AAVGGDARIGRITPSGSTGIVVGGHGRVAEITAGPDGNVWAPATYTYGPPGSYVARVRPDLATSDFYTESARGDFEGITAAAGDLWLTAATDDSILRVTVSGGMTTYPVPRHLEGVAGFGAH